MAFVGELEIVDDLAHLPHLLDHRLRLGDGAARIVGSAGEEDRGPDFVEEVDRGELAVPVGVDLGLPHLLAVVPPEIAALVRRGREPVEISDDAHADRPEVGRLLQDMRHGVTAIAHADRPQTVGCALTVLDQPPASGDDVLDVPAAQVMVAQTAPGASIAGAAAVVRREDRESLRGHELKARVPFVERLRLRTAVWVHHGGVAEAIFSRHEEPRRNRLGVEARIPHELSGGELVLGKGLPEAVDEGYPPLAPPEDEARGLREFGMLVEQALRVRSPDGPARGALRGGHRSGALAISRDGLQLDVSISVLQEREPLSVRGPEGHRLVPPALDQEPDFLGLYAEDTEVHVVVDVRDEGELPTIRGPGPRPAEVSPDRALRFREWDDFLHVTGETDEADIIH